MIEPLIYHRVTDLNPLMVNVPPKIVLKSFSTKVSTFGSCFAQHSARVLEELGFDTYYQQSNCFHYSTSSLLQLLQFSVGELNLSDGVFWCKNRNKYISLFHRDIDGESLEIVSKRMDVAKNNLLAGLNSTSVFIVTIGSATYLKDKISGSIICHANGSLKNSYTTEEESTQLISQNLKEICRILLSFKNDAEIFFTVSPQRYSWSFSLDNNTIDKDFYDELYNSEAWLTYNNYDKSKIRVGLIDFLKENSALPTTYFPSFDIVVDELRGVETMHNSYFDYLHVALPTTSNYVINRFLNAYCSKSLKNYLSFFRDCYNENTKSVYMRYSGLSHTEKIKFLDSLETKLLSFDNAMNSNSLLKKLLNDFKNDNVFLDHSLHSEIANRLGLKHKNHKNQLLNHLDCLGNNKCVVIYGLGINLKALYIQAQSLHCEIVIVARENDMYRQVFDTKVLGVDKLNTVKFDYLYISSEGSYFEIKKSLLKLGVEEEKIA